jgi:hypothetical protein
MAFLRKPHYISSPHHGWLTVDLIAQHPEDCPCETDLAGQIHDDFIGGEPDLRNPYEPDRPWPNSGELDCSTQLTGCTKESEELYATREWTIVWQSIYRHLILKAAAQAEETRLKLIRDRAAQDPAYAVLAKQLGIPI